MHRPRTPRAPTRTLAQFEDSEGLQSAISDALGIRPVNESILREGVRTYVGGERRAGTSPGRVIFTLTELIERSMTAPKAEQHALMRRVILWCVEAYFTDVATDVEHRGQCAFDSLQLDEALPAPAGPGR